MVQILPHQQIPVRSHRGTKIRLLGNQARVPQVSVLGSVLFNSYLNDIFHFVEYANNFADDTTPNFNGYDMNEVLMLSIIAVEWSEVIL